MRFSRPRRFEQQQEAVVGVQVEYKRFQEFQVKETSRYKRIEEKSVEAETLAIGHGSREVGRKTSS
jgi:hypothetical protein